MSEIDKSISMCECGNGKSKNKLNSVYLFKINGVPI